MTHLLKNKKRLLAVLLSGTILSAANNAACGETPPAETNFNEAVKHQIALSGGKYTRQQAETRALGAWNGNFNYPNRSDKALLDSLFNSCAQADYSAGQVPETAKKLWENMQLLKKGKTLMGATIANFAAEANIFYCYAQLRSDQNATWSAAEGVTRISSNGISSQEDLFLSQVHETIHGLQTANGLVNDDYSRSIADMQASLMSIEAAAAAGENLLAVELYLSDKDGRWKQKDNPRFDVNLMIYKNTLKKGGTPAEALTTIGTLEFGAWFRDNFQLDFYNEYLLKKYVRLLVQGNMKPPSGAAHSLSASRMAGYISPEFNYTAEIGGIPPYEERFGGDSRMRQAFDYAESERLAYTLGRDNPAYLNMLERLKKENNPYLGIDLKEVYESKIPGGLLEKMNAFTKVKSPQLAKMAP